MFRYRWILTLILIIILPFILLSIPLPVTRTIKTTLLSALSPVVKGFSSVKTGVAKPFTYFSQLKNALKENEQYQQENEELKQKLLELDELKAENTRLLLMLQLEKKAPGIAKTARIVGWDPIEWHYTVLIDKGKKNGIDENMPVINGEGIIGKVIEAGDSMSKVLLVIDKTSRVSALIQRSREAGIIEGREQDFCRMNYLSREADIVEGDKVVTSGTGGIFPKGILIGTVTKVYLERFGLHKSADIEPAVNFGKIEELLVLVQHSKRTETSLKGE